MKNGQNVERIIEFFQMRYNATIESRSDKYIGLIISETQLLCLLPEEESFIRQINLLYPNSNGDGFSYNVSLQLQEDARWEGTVSGHCFHLYALLSLLLGEELTDLSEQEKTIWENACREVNAFLNAE